MLTHSTIYRVASLITTFGKLLQLEPSIGKPMNQSVIACLIIIQLSSTKFLMESSKAGEPFLMLCSICGSFSWWPVFLPFVCAKGVSHKHSPTFCMAQIGKVWCKLFWSGSVKFQVKFVQVNNFVAVFFLKPCTLTGAEVLCPSYMQCSGFFFSLWLVIVSDSTFVIIYLQNLQIVSSIPTRVVNRCLGPDSSASELQCVKTLIILS